jgi:hypothetical protein
VLALAAPLPVVNSYLIGVVLNVGHMLEQASSIDALVTIPSATTEQATPVKDVAHAGSSLKNTTRVCRIVVDVEA